jgi:localization factor PodJL
MPFADESTKPAARAIASQPLPPALLQHEQDAHLAGMQRRLAELHRRVDHARGRLPGEFAEALGRIEDGIGRLGEGVRGFVAEHALRARPHQARPGAAAPATAPADFPDPWDAQSAEALTRVCEAAAAEGWGGPRRAQEGARTTAPLPAERDAWLEQRLAAIATLLGRSMAHNTSDKALAALDRRLARFDERLEIALERLARRSDSASLVLIEAHVRELNAQFEAARGQLGRLEGIDNQLRELSGLVKTERQPVCAANQRNTSDDDLESRMQRAVDRAVRQASQPPVDPHRVAALEGLLQNWFAEQRRSEEASAAVLQSIEEALTRIGDRIDALDAAKADERDGLAIESERLAEAYAAGVRLLGQDAFPSTLDAADYVPPLAQGWDQPSDAPGEDQHPR